MKATEIFKNMKMENKLLLLAVSCGLAAAVLGYFFIANKESDVMKSMEPVRVLSAAKYITPRSQVREDMVKFVEVPAKLVTSAHVKSFDQLKGKLTLVPFIEGEAILLNKMSAKAEDLSSAVPTGLRAVAVAVDEESAVSYMIKPGDYVDVLLTYDTSDSKKSIITTATILQAAQVLSAGTEFNAAAGGKKGYNTLTLALSPEEAEIIVYAREKGRLSFALRGAGDTIKEKIMIATFDGLLAQIKSNEKPVAAAAARVNPAAMPEADASAEGDEMRKRP